jgi:nitrile hydratase
MGKVLKAGRVREVLRQGASARRAEAVAARFRPGEKVITRNDHPSGHTRLPRYLRGRVGVIDRDHGVFVFADAHAMGGGPCPQHLYSVRFAATTLWGSQGHARDAIYADLWDDHLDHA